MYYCGVCYTPIFLLFIVGKGADTRTAILPTDISVSLGTFTCYLPFVNHMKEINTFINYGANSIQNIAETFCQKRQIGFFASMSNKLAPNRSLSSIM